MSDIFEGESISLTSHEVITLLSLNENDASARAKRVLKLSANQETAETVLAGISTLHVRGLAKIHLGVVAPTGAGKDLARILTNGTSWATINAESGGVTHTRWITTTGEESLRLTRADLGVFLIESAQTGVDVIEQASLVAQESLLSADGVQVTVTITDPEGQKDASVVRAADVYRVASGADAIEAGAAIDSIETALRSLEATLRV